MSQYYDGTKLLSLSDIDGLKPEIYMVMGNRTAGKTYYFKRMILRRFIKTGKKFLCLVRFTYELDGFADNFFKDLEEIHFTGHKMEQKPIGKNLFVELYFDGVPCGYVVALNTADTIKKYSSRFVDVDCMFMDEFQSEIGKYCPDEITKFQSIHTSVARGGGKQSRYVPVYMASNNASIINPYFAAFDIATRLSKNTKFLRGNGWVLEVTYNQNASKAMKESGFGRAFKNSSYMDYATNNKSLLDTDAFICKMKGDCSPYATVYSDGKEFGLWSYDHDGILYVSHKTDPNEVVRITFKTEDHNVNYIMLQTADKTIKKLKKLFEHGAVRFADMECKNMFVEMIGYSII